ncbi:FtsX-like permease family protein [Sediminibacillus dalangtanensis]|uniref:FtsX-like permease family protein n=1 Tax=Sediminibacillus dalangtanensis TaxID=2729421 RepID=A0ABX7VWQ1_9BACI|nr:ABC transporter permease [Sediminibacillus dalangtanensis]QTN01102.1 FtsX-like permease family protein [Sediminibacillus dalangtanensis]
MNINQLIVRNLKKNLKNYYLYVFALVFSVALYFAFVTMQYDPAMDEAKSGIKGAAGVRAASVLLVAIVSVFLLYANNLFIKRRSQEIGLFQLIGMTKNRIFRILSAENLMIYFGSLAIGIAVGFSVSKLITMAFFKVTGIEAVANLYFSSQALVQTLIVFSAIYLLIMLMNYLFIRRQSILSLFRVTSRTEEKVKKISIWEILMGILGLGLILTGYYVSSKLFDGDFNSITQLYMLMLFILGSVIIGTYFFYKGSVRFVANLIRKNKDGYLNINEVLSLSSIMFRMKSNALLLTIITTVSALAIALLSLTYISYYSAEKTAETMSPDDFSLISQEAAKNFGDKLTEHGIAYQTTEIEVLTANVDITEITDANLEEFNTDGGKMTVPVISDASVEGVDVTENETLFTGYSDALQKMINLDGEGNVKIYGKNEEILQRYAGLSKEKIISNYFTVGGLPTAIVDRTTYDQLKRDVDPALQQEASTYIGITLTDEDQVKVANDIFQSMEMSEEFGNYSLYQSTLNQKQIMGLTMFIVGFLGLTFLVTSGCILYFKQMGESEEEKPSYTILRKLGFTRKDLEKGIRGKQIFNFGIPLVVGLLHSYFAVRSGWFFFGTELWTPMLIVMGLYTALYSIFGFLSFLYYKKIIHESL